MKERRIFYLDRMIHNVGLRDVSEWVDSRNPAQIAEREDRHNCRFYCLFRKFFVSPNFPWETVVLPE